MSTVIRHDDTSLAEGHPGKIRVITPFYLSYEPLLDSFQTNYT